MSNQSEWSSKVDEYVDSLIQGTPGQPNATTAVAPAGSLRTAQGGETLSPAGATAGSLSPALIDVHGAVYDGYNIERTLQSEQDVESLQYQQQRVRVGDSIHNDSVGLPDSSVFIERSDYNVPTNNVAPNVVNNVSTRFIR
jgi:hypothetical protein